MALISILLPDLRGGGVERVKIVLAREFQKLGHNVEFVLLQARGELIAEAEVQFSIVDLACPRIRSLPLALLSYLRERRPDALLAAMWPLTTIAPFVARVAGGPRTLISEHGILSAQYKGWGSAHRVGLQASTRLGYRLADSRVAVSVGVAQDMAQLSGMGGDAFTVIHNPVPLRSRPGESALAVAEETWRDRGGVRILTVGNLKEVKNHALLLKAFSCLEEPKGRLMVVGEGALRPALERFAGELGISERVSFPGFHPDPTPFYHTADLFVLSSNYEGFGNVIVEALASGTPVVSTDCPSGPDEILEKGRWGRLTPVGDAEALAAAMRASLEERHDIVALKRRAAEFSPEIAAKRYHEALALA